uniref:Uncharacterized protein n=1 Tax=Lactuca sativa TaxID=4236 RepID=A0A9R1WEM8_LACSA|nr:hypothetical protein LSAT_V11C100002500 [Lactuca sativa]
MKSHIDRLRMLGVDISGELAADWILQSLPESYSEFVREYYMMEHDVTLIDLTYLLIATESSMIWRAGQTNLLVNQTPTTRKTAFYDAQMTTHNDLCYAKESDLKIVLSLQKNFKDLRHALLRALKLVSKEKKTWRALYLNGPAFYLFSIFHLLNRLSSLGSSLSDPIRFSATPDLLLIGLESTLILTSIAASNSKSSQLTSSKAFATKKAKSSGAKAGNKKAQPKSKVDVKQSRNRKRMLVPPSMMQLMMSSRMKETGGASSMKMSVEETGGGAAVAIC